MSEQKELSRDSDLYQDTMKTKVINDVSYESKILEITEARHAYKYYYELNWKSLSEKGSEKGLSRDELANIRSMSPEERAKRFGKTITSHTWKARGEASMEIEMKLKIELPDGEETTVFVKQEINSFHDIGSVGSIVSAADSDESVDISVVNEDSYTLRIKDKSFRCKDKISYRDGFSITKSHKKGTKQVLSFAKSGQRWAEAIVKRPIEDGDTIVIPVKLNDEIIEFCYDSPDSNDEFWSIVDDLGNGDPLLIEDEKVYVSHSLISGDGLFDNQIWVVNSQKPTYIRTLADRLKNYISRIKR